MPRTDIKNSYLIAERIRKTVEAQPIGPERIPITISGGVTTLQPHMKTPQDFIESADQALYQAKDAGRNRLVQLES